jgi:hypothetical protein
MTVWYTKGIYVSFVNCFVVILPHHNNFLQLLGNKEFELVVFGMTFAVVTKRSASGHGVSVLSVGDR